MGQRHETYFETAGREINTSRQGAVKYFRKSVCVPLRNLIDAPDQVICPCMQPEDRGGSRQLKWPASLLHLAIHLITEAAGFFFQYFVSADAFDLLQRRQAGAHSHRVCA